MNDDLINQWVQQNIGLIRKLRDTEQSSPEDYDIVCKVIWHFSEKPETMPGVLIPFPGKAGAL